MQQRQARGANSKLVWQLATLPIIIKKNPHIEESLKLFCYVLWALFDPSPIDMAQIKYALIVRRMSGRISGALFEVSYQSAHRVSVPLPLKATRISDEQPTRRHKGSWTMSWLGIAASFR